jgi:hypothetical protein
MIISDLIKQRAQPGAYTMALIPIGSVPGAAYGDGSRSFVYYNGQKYSTTDFWSLIRDVDPSNPDNPFTKGFPDYSNITKRMPEAQPYIDAMTAFTPPPPAPTPDMYYDDPGFSRTNPLESYPPQQPKPIDTSSSLYQDRLSGSSQRIGTTPYTQASPYQKSNYMGMGTTPVRAPSRTGGYSPQSAYNTYNQGRNRFASHIEEIKQSYLRRPASTFSRSYY